VDQLLVDEVLHLQGLYVVVHVCPVVVALQPSLSLVRQLLVERQVDRLLVLLVAVAELDLVFLQVREILLRL